MTMKALRTLAFSLALLTAAAAHAGERQALESYVSPAPSLMPILAKQTDAIGLTAEQQAKLAEWRKVAQPKREQMEKDIIADRLAINQAMLNSKGNPEVQAMMRTLQRKEIKLVVAKLACRDYAKKTLTRAQWDKVVALYNAQ
jgi:phosphoglycolate phosphatase-like HAD superfamily hydrolase